MYRIIVDSCGDLTKHQKQDYHFIQVPFRLHIGDWYTLDDENFSQEEYLVRLKESKKAVIDGVPPAPEVYYEAMIAAGDVDLYVVTASAKISASYQNAKVAEDMYREQFPNRNIFVFDTGTLSVGETLIGIKIEELIHMSLPFERIVQFTKQYIREMHTFCVLHKTEVLHEDGIIAHFRNQLSQQLLMTTVFSLSKDTSIRFLGQSNWMRRALIRTVNRLLAVTNDQNEKVLMIAHCDNKELAAYIGKYLKAKSNFLKIYVVDTGGESTRCLGKKGIVLVV